MKDLFKFIESDEPTLSDDYYELIADEDISISVGDGTYMLSHWLPDQGIFKQAIFTNLNKAMKAACQTYALNGVRQ